MTTASTLPVLAAGTPPAGGAPPGEPPGAPGFEGALGDQMARTAPAEGQHNNSPGDTRRAERGHRSERTASPAAADGGSQQAQASALAAQQPSLGQPGASPEATGSQATPAPAADAAPAAEEATDVLAVGASSAAGAASGSDAPAAGLLAAGANATHPEPPAPGAGDAAGVATDHAGEGDFAVPVAGTDASASASSAPGAVNAIPTSDAGPAPGPGPAAPGQPAPASPGSVPARGTGSARTEAEGAGGAAARSDATAAPTGAAESSRTQAVRQDARDGASPSTFGEDAPERSGDAPAPAQAPVAGHADQAAEPEGGTSGARSAARAEDATATDQSRDARAGRAVAARGVAASKGGDAVTAVATERTSGEGTHGDTRGGARGTLAGAASTRSDATEPAPGTTPTAPAERAQPTTSGGVSEPPATSAGLEDMIEAIHATVEMAARRGSSQARIALQPAELGEIRIHLSQSAEGLIARVTADTPAAARQLAAGHGELSQSLSSLNTTLLRLDIGLAGGQQRHEQQIAGQQEPRRRGPAPTGEDASIAGSQDAQPTTTRTALGELVDVLA